MLVEICNDHLVVFRKISVNLFVFENEDIKIFFRKHKEAVSQSWQSQ
jgi:hypothetical protein